jgi:diguanylate cyclase (GGDEF)-like protein/PAS domain S-box-containing protein
VSAHDAEHGPDGWADRFGPDVEALLDALPDAVVALDEQGDVLWFPHSVATRMGWPVEHFVGRSAFPYIHPDDVAIATEAFATTMREPARQLPFGCRVRCRDGSWFRVELTASVASLPRADGRRQRVMLGSLRERTGAMSAESVLTLMAAAAPFGEVVEAILRVASADVMGWRAAVVAVDDRGVREVHAGTLPPAMFAVGAADPTSDAVEAVPWDRTLQHGDDVEVVDLARLPAALADLARQHELVGCWSLAVPHPGNQGEGDRHPPGRAAGPRTVPACALVVWSASASSLGTLPLWVRRDIVPMVRLALEQRHARAQLEWAARYDSLTGLPNRPHLFDVMDRTLTRCHDGYHVGVLYVDLDGFKAINDSRGHLHGDEVLAAAARRLADELRPGDVIGRIGGDEFVIVCPGCRDTREVEAIGQRLVAAMSGPVSFADGTSVTIGVSVGALLVRDGSMSSEDALLQADAALYHAKSRGRGRVVTVP